MRFLPLAFIIAASLSAAEPEYPLWDGRESVADYAKRVNLPATQTLDLGNDVKLELVLIPAGTFIMGTPEPKPVDEYGFQKKFMTGETLLGASAAALLAVLAVVITRAIRRRQRPNFSLAWLLTATAVAGMGVLSLTHWKESARELEKARAEYAAAKARYDLAEADEKPSHSVTLTKPCYMGKYVVTQKQFKTALGANPSLDIGESKPVDPVSWDDAQEFCKKLTQETKQRVRLPTEAEWEFACRAGTTTTYHSGDAESDLARVAWYSSNSNSTMHPVGQKAANAFGLYDMHGNVWQWCEDWYAADYYRNSGAENPVGPPEGAERVLRGGDWFDHPPRCRAAARREQAGNTHLNMTGFRVVLEPSSRAP